MSQKNGHTFQKTVTTNSFPIYVTHSDMSQIEVTNSQKFLHKYFDLTLFVVEKFGNRDARDLDVYAKLTKQREFKVSGRTAAEFTLGQ